MPEPVPKRKRDRARMRRAVWHRGWVLEGELGCTQAGPVTFTIDRTSTPATIEVRFNEALRRAGCPVPDDVRFALAATSPPRLGGERWWFVCPICTGRCGVVYLRPPVERPWDPARWGCRRCQELVYPVQREHMGDRAIRRLRTVLGQAGAAFTPFLVPRPHHRPKGMHHARFRCLVSEAERLFLRAAAGGRGARRRMQQLWG
jgi:hypothetical protein